MAAPNDDTLVQRMVRAINTHDLDALVACFAEDYVNETPAHPMRGFRGREQVRRNWSQILAGVPDLRARVPRTAVDGTTVWSEWELSGTRAEREPFELRGVVIFGVAGGAAAWARFFLEPLDVTTGDVDTATARMVGNTTNVEEAS
ncbi:hypothetical protein BH20ACT5_BH20ACT5_19420 [soil metagenome]